MELERGRSRSVLKRGPNGGAGNCRGRRGKNERSAITWRWIGLCPKCGFKVSGQGNPKSGERLARCGGCRRTLYLAWASMELESRKRFARWC